MAESKPRSSSRLSAEENDQRRRGGRSKTSSSNRHTSKSHGKSTKDQRGSRSNHRREEEDQEAKRRARDFTKSLRSEQIAEEDRETKRRARDSTRSSTSRQSDSDRDAKEQAARRSTRSHGSGRVQPGAYTSSSNDMAERKSRRSTSTTLSSTGMPGQQLNFPSELSDGSLDLLDDAGDNTHFLSAQEIEDQRAKLSTKSTKSSTSTSISSRTPTPGAQPQKSGRPSSSKGVFRKSETKPTGPISSSNRQSQNADPMGERGSLSSSSAPVNAMAVEEMENERVARLEEANQQLQREMEELRRGGKAQIVQAEEAKPPSSKRTWIIIGILVCLAVVAGGAVAGVMMAGGGDDNDSDGGDSSGTVENPSDPLDASGGGAATNNPNSTTTPSVFIPITDAPTLLPSQSPSEPIPFDPPSSIDCLAMSNGAEVSNQASFLDKNFTVGLDVSLSLETINGELEPILAEKIQESLVPALAGCPTSSRRRLGNNHPNTATIPRRLMSGNYVIGNAVANVVCDTETDCRLLDSRYCYQCLVNLQVFLKEDVSGLILSISEVVEEDLTGLLGLPPPFIEVKAFSIDSLDPTPFPSTAPSAIPSFSPTRMPSLRPSTFPSNEPTTKITGSPTQNPTDRPTPQSTPGPTKPPTQAPTPVPTPQPIAAPTAAPILQTTPGPTLAPAPSPVSCPAWTDYFDGPWKPDILEQGAAYEIGCEGSPVTMIALVADEDNCVRCLGMLVESDYRAQCDDVDCMLFQIPGATGEAIYLGYASQLSEDDILPSCPGMTLADNNDGSTCKAGSGPGFPGPRHQRML